MGNTRFTLGILLAVGTSLAGCRDSDISAYQIPKEARPMPGLNFTGGAASGHNHGAANDPRWTAPAGWTVKEVTEFRRGSYSYRDSEGREADISVSSFPDGAGGRLANLNRWRGQVNLPPIAESEWDAHSEVLQVDGHEVTLVEMTSPVPMVEEDRLSIQGALVSHGGQSWFFKMMGPEPAVSSQREPFLSMVRSLTFPGHDAPVATAAAAPTGMPAGGLGMDMMKQGSEVAPPPKAPSLSYLTPGGWQAQPPTQFRAASFLIPAPDGGAPADMSVIALPGPVGGDLANVNRWRGQLGLPPVSPVEFEASLQRVQTVDGATLALVDLVSQTPVLNNRLGRILGAIRKEGELTWFFKMTGEADHVASEKAAFVAFARSMQIGEPTQP
jgi:hypothetical protein